MEVRESTTTERTVTVNGVTFTVRELAPPLGFLRYGNESWNGAGHEQTLRRMVNAGLVEKVVQRSDYDMSVEGHKYRQIDGKCSELFDRLNEPYHRLRPKVKRKGGFGMLDEQEDAKARERAEHVVAELNERNPDVEFILDEEELNSFPTGGGSDNE